MARNSGYYPMRRDGARGAIRPRAIFEPSVRQLRMAAGIVGPCPAVEALKTLLGGGRPLRAEGGAEVGFEFVFAEGSFDGHEVSAEEVGGGPAEGAGHAFVFVVHGGGGAHAAVGVDVEGDAGSVKEVDGVVFPAVDGGDDLDVGAGAELEVDVVIAEVGDEGGVFVGAGAVADAGGLEELEGFPDAFGAEGFAGVGGAEEVVLAGVAVGFDVRGQREASFVGCDIEGGDAGAFELVDELCGGEGLLGGVVAESAEDEAGFDAGGSDHALGGAVGDGDDLLGCEAGFEVEERGEADFGVDDVVGGELAEEVFDDEVEVVLGLHEEEASRGAAEELGEVGAAGGGDEVGVVLGAGGCGGEVADDFVA
jgi:hypothetical protein